MVSTSEKENHTNLALSKICMLISAISMGTVGLFVSFLSGFQIYTIVLLRGLFGTLFLTLFMLRSHSFNKDFIKESFRFHWKPLLIVGIINPIVIYLYFVSITISGYAIAAFLLYTSGVFVLVLLMVTKTEKVSKINIISFLLAIIGVAIIMEFWNGVGITSGIIVGLLSGLTLAILIFCKKKIYIERKENPSITNVNGDFDTFLAWWPTMFIIFLLLPLGDVDLINITMFELLVALLLGLLPTALAFTLYNIGVKNDKGGNIIILAYFEPIMASILMIIFVQYISIYTIIGGALIVIANIIVLKFSD